MFCSLIPEHNFLACLSFPYLSSSVWLMQFNFIN
ncbi:hypothetical protein Patl1_33932 [Pistacia atlantica]|uniref:Uncharacterized protein n=1 Tax=Pistacia atlantica TaxID=434234 RepID=A0ACC0ZUK8_9ROSI|nr:hypothetical protein Patl1_33932 [Pistacia atlantica]